MTTNTTHTRRRRPARRALTITASAILVLISRALFFCHSGFTAWRVVDKLGEWYLIVGVVVIFSAIEIYWVLFRRKAKEWTWFSVPVFLYLMTVVPGIWLLRLEQVNNYRNMLGNTADCNKTLPNGEQNANCNGTVVDAVETLSTQFGFAIPLKLDPNTWLELLDQSLIFILIITRWIAPFGRASHRKLSEQLFVYVGLGSDIVELFVLYEEPYVLQKDLLVYWILGTWTLSLTQFMLPLTGAIAPSDTKDIDKTPGACRDCMRNEAWTIVAIVMLQDGPFLAIRLYIMIAGGLVNYSLAFFTVKNILVVCLQIYRFFVLACCVDHATGRSIRRKRRPQTDRSSTERTNSSNSNGGNGVTRLDSSGVVIIAEAVEEEEEEEEVYDNDIRAELGDIEDQRPTPRQRNGYSNNAYSSDSLDRGDNAA